MLTKIWLNQRTIFSRQQKKIHNKHQNSKQTLLLLFLVVVFFCFKSEHLRIQRLQNLKLPDQKL